MENKLMIEFLKYLELAYPLSCNAEKLRNKLRLPSLNGEFFKIIKYLKDTNKITIYLSETKVAPTAREELNTRDKITITPEGIDFLFKLKRLVIDNKRTMAIANATVVLALVGFIQALIYFKQFSKEVNDLIGLLALLVIGVLLIIIFSISWQSYMYLMNSSK
jgi:hypothetical protein